MTCHKHPNPSYYCIIFTNIGMYGEILVKQ
jgi:hypothetical protein